MKSFLFKLSFFIFPNLAFANSYINLTTELTQFDYQEYSSTGKKFNSENGLTHGLSASYNYSSDNKGFNLSASYIEGSVDYQGQTQADIPLSTTTDERFTDIGAEFFWFPISSNLGIYTKLQHYQWQRNILSTPVSLGLEETYEWQNFEAGFISNLYRHGNHTLELKLGLSKSRNGKIDVNLSEIGFGNPKLDLGDGSGAYSALTYQLKLSKKKQISFGLAHRDWKFSSGNSKQVSSNTQTVIIREPRSKSKRTSFFITYGFSLD